MSCIHVYTQAELDVALERGDCVYLRGDGHFVVDGTSTVNARDSSVVRAYDNSTVREYGKVMETALMTLSGVPDLPIRERTPSLSYVFGFYKANDEGVGERAHIQATQIHPCPGQISGDHLLQSP